MTANRIIEKAGGQKTVAKHFKLTDEAIRKCCERGIPAKHWLRLSKLSGIAHDRIARHTHD